MSARKWLHAAVALLLVIHLVWDIRARDSFSWMDPVQYYNAATQIAAGQAGLAGFPVASSYPLLLGLWVRLNGAIPFALASNALWLAVLAFAAWHLARHFGAPELAPLLLFATLAAPAVCGLSRELYLEFPLAALVALHSVVWFQRDRRASARGYWLLFGGLMLLGFSIKMTYPVFLFGPVLAEELRAVRRRAWRPAAGLALAFFVPVILALGLMYWFAPQSREYYASGGNIRIPVTRLIGPPEGFSTAALGYYPGQLVRNFLFLLFPFALGFVWRAGAARPAGPAARDRLDLWLWWLVPVVAFSLLPVREPRHIAPAAMPMLLLVLLGIQSVRRTRLRRVILGGVWLAGAIQMIMVSTHAKTAPYLLDRPIRAPAIQGALFRTLPDSDAFALASGASELNRWRFTRSLLMSGFEPNEALAVAWALHPGVVMDLDAFADARRQRLPHGYSDFADLFLLNAFNLYNWRCGWRGHYDTLTRAEALAAADALLVVVRRAAPAPVHAGYELAARIDWGADEQIAIYRPEALPRKSFRRIYAETYLIRNPAAPAPELNAILKSLRLDAALRGRAAEAGEFRPFFPPGFRAGEGPEKNIYFLSVYRPLLASIADNNERP